MYYQMSTNIDFGDWLQKQLDTRGMTQADLARKSALSTATISRLMGGSRGLGIEAIKSLSIALDMPPEAIFKAAIGIQPDNFVASPDWQSIFGQLDPDDYEDVMDFLKMKLQKRKRAKPPSPPHPKHKRHSTISEAGVTGPPNALK